MGTLTHRCIQIEVLTSHVIVRVFGSVDSLRTPKGLLSGTGGRRWREKDT